MLALQHVIVHKADDVPEEVDQRFGEIETALAAAGLPQGDRRLLVTSYPLAGTLAEAYLRARGIRDRITSVEHRAGSLPRQVR